jgi:mono/diheme cytochrome c family protein
MVRVVLVLLGLTACDDFRVCDIPSADRVGLLPTHLSETGIANGQPYMPNFALWSDGATKDRWFSLPAGTAIDTSDPDEWRFPEGTRAWKQFTVDGTPIETRMIAKVGPDDADWVDVAYVWLADGSDAIATPEGASNAGGTAHDVPDAGQCAGCHGGRASHLLGISAVQLARDGLPQPALGYLFANCSHCHNQRRPARSGARCFDPENDVDFDLLVGELDDPPAFQTIADHGDAMIERMSQRGEVQMPPLATETVDDAGLALVRALVDERRKR